MPRANRYFLPGNIWNITNRCHKKEFLFKFSRDRNRWLRWLYEAKKRFGLCILNYVVTSNHIHLLIFDTGQDTIRKSIQLITSRTAQEYNRRKSRQGAFWEDRYHATAIESGGHFFQCMTYIDMNMVRAGVVTHPEGWAETGYNEIQKPPRRYKLIDRKALLNLFETPSDLALREVCRQMLEEQLRTKSTRNSEWSESIAAGGKLYLEEIKEGLGIRGIYRNVYEKDGRFVLREPQVPYSIDFGGKNSVLSIKSKKTEQRGKYSSINLQKCNQ